MDNDNVLLYADQVNTALSLCLTLFRHIPASVFAPQATSQALLPSQPTRAPKSKPSTPTPGSQHGRPDSNQASATVISFDVGMSAKDYIEEFYILQPATAATTTTTTTSEESSAKEYAGIKGHALTHQALTLVQNFISNVLDTCMKDEEGVHTKTLRPMILKACKTLAILSRYQSPPIVAEDYFSGPWLEKMRTTCCKVRLVVPLSSVCTFFVE